MKFSKHLIAAALTTVCAVSAFAQNVTVTDAWARATVQGQKATGAFMKITAKDNAKLVSASSSAAGVVEIHEMKMDAGVMRMRELAQGLALPAGETVALRPGGYHLMLMDLRAPLREGTPVPVTLVFERAGRIEVELKVEAPTARQSGHGDHGAGHAAPAGPHKHSH